MVDELEPSATGELVVSGSEGPRGAVFVERGRVCWAAARGLARRLSRLLGARASLEPSAMESIFLYCKERRVPLGEHLVTRGVLRPEDLRVALLQHTVESLHHLCAHDARAAWYPRAGAGYSPQFTFATAELFAHIGAVTHAATASRLEPVLRASFGDGDWAAAFVRTNTRGFPEPVATHGAVPASASTLLRIGKWAATALDLTRTFTDDGALLAVTRRTRGANTCLVAFRSGDAFVAGETCEYGPGRILNRRAQLRRMKGVSDADL